MADTKKVETKSAFEKAKEMAKTAKPKEVMDSATVPQEKGMPEVVIKTDRKVEISVRRAGVAQMFEGTQFSVPYEQVGDVKRMIAEAYPGITIS